MEDTQSDFTMTFRQLSEASVQQLHDRNFTQVDLKWQYVAFLYLDFVLKLVTSLISVPCTRCLGALPRHHLAKVKYRINMTKDACIWVLQIIISVFLNRELVFYYYAGFPHVKCCYCNSKTGVSIQKFNFDFKASLSWLQSFWFVLDVGSQRLVIPQALLWLAQHVPAPAQQVSKTCKARPWSS